MVEGVLRWGQGTEVLSGEVITEQRSERREGGRCTGIWKQAVQVEGTAGAQALRVIPCSRGKLPRC